MKLVLDDYNDSKAHAFKREGGKLYYNQWIGGRPYYEWSEIDESHGYYNYYLR